MKRTIVAIAAGLCLALYAGAQPARDTLATDLLYYMPSEWTYTLNKDVPTPADGLGFRLGEQHAEWKQVETYMRRLAEVSPRITVKEYGRTYERRPFLCVTITSERNHGRLEEIRTGHLRLIDPAASGALDVSAMPAVVHIMNSVHGNEASSVNASLAFAYFFAAAEGEEIDALLDGVVINLIPGQNPDGISRFASWVNANRSFPDVADPLSRELNEPWPGGRSNHYWHDLNRDWLPVQQPEMKYLMKIYHEWMPNTVGDFHEMGSNSTYFLEPSDPVCYYPAIPEENKALTARVSEYNMKALDRIGSLYLSKDLFDSYYLGTGDVYGDALGSIAMLFEQASSRGNVQKTDNGMLTFPFTVRNQAVCAFGTVKASYELRETLLDYMRRFCADRLREAAALPVKAYVFDGNGSEAISFHFIELLRAHNLEVSKLARDITLNGHAYSSDRSYIVPVQQRNSMILRSLFESTKQFRDSLFYDVSTWNMAEAFNLNFAPVTTAATAGSLTGEAIAAPAFRPGRVEEGMSTYAYLFDNREYYAPALVKGLQEAGLTVRVSGRGARSDDGTVARGPGMFVLPVAGQKLAPKEIFDRVVKLAVETGVDVQAVSTSKMKDFDLGHTDTHPLREPKIALLAGQGFNTGECGSIWYLLNWRLRMKPAVLDAAALGRGNLNEYNVIIIPSSRGTAIAGSAATKLAEWVRAGGTLIATGASYRVVNDLKLGEVKEKKLTRQDSSTYIPYDRRSDRAAMYDIPGTHLQARIDTTHPVAWGYAQPTLPVLKNSPLAFEMPKEVNAAPAVYDRSPQLSGFLRPEHSRELAGTPAVICGTAGSGHYICIADDLTFRSYWYGGARMFTNIILFGNLIR